MTSSISRPMLLEAVERASSTGLAAVDETGTQIYVNPAFCAMVGFSADELLGKKPPFAYWSPAAYDAIERSLRETIDGEAAPDGYELEFVRKSGEPVLVKLKIAPLATEDGARVGFLASVEDITQRKALEETRVRLEEERRARAREGATRKQLEMVLDALPVGVMLAQADGNVAYTNSAAQRIFGGPIDDPGRAEDYDGTFRAWDAEGRPLASSDFPIVRALNGERVEAQEVTFASPSGERRTVRANAAPIRDADGNILFAVTAYYDVTDAKKMEDARARLFEAEQAANRAKDEFLAMLGHELRNPLAPIVSALALLRHREGAMSKPLEIVERQVGHMIRLVDDLLDVSRITRGKIELRNVRVGVVDVLVRAIEMVKPLVDARSQIVQLDLRVPEAFVVGDPARLAQVFGNVLTNSAKYSDPGTEIRITVALEREQAIVSVRDQGSGIAPELLPVVFDAFVQGPQDIARRRGGLGLGLAIVKSLVELHRGTVELRSDGRGRGAEVTIRLPLGGAASAEVAPAVARAAEPMPALRVLVVDDNEDAATLMSELLGWMGHEPDVRHDGLAAIEAIARGRHDVVLLDIGLPGVDGYEVARRIRRDGSPVRLIALTGYGQDNDKQLAYAAGFDAHLVKPVDAETLERTLRQAWADTTSRAGGATESA